MKYVAVLYYTTVSIVISCCISFADDYRYEDKYYVNTSEYVKVYDEILESEEYQKKAISCKVCDSVRLKSYFESVIKNDAKYANKYGVVNLTKKARNVEAIKNHDETIIEGKAEYKEITGKKFNITECKTCTAEFCVNLNMGDYLKSLTIAEMKQRENEFKARFTKDQE